MLRSRKNFARLAAAALVADVRGASAAALGGLALAVADRTAALARAGRWLVGELEAQGAADRVGFGEAKLEAHSGFVGVAAVLADQRLARFLVAEIFAAERRRRDQPVAAEPLNGGEEAEGLDAGDAAVDDGSDLF